MKGTEQKKVLGETEKNREEETKEESRMGIKRHGTEDRTGCSRIMDRK